MSLRARGFAIPVVIALVVVFAAVLGTALVAISSAQHVGLGLDIQGVKAYYAARAGLEWGMYHVLRTGDDCTGVNGQSVVFDGNLSGFRATLECSESLHQEGGVALNVYAITATACNAASCSSGTPQPGYANRQLRATLTR
jgi:MSHA biogenesis protein MshP